MPGSDAAQDRERVEKFITQYAQGELEAYQSAHALREHTDRMLTWAIGLMGAGVFSANALLANVPRYPRVGALLPWTVGILVALAGRVLAHELSGKESLWHFEKAVRIRILLLKQDPGAAMTELLAIIERRGELSKRYETSKRLGTWLDGLYYATHILFAIGMAAVVGFAAFAPRDLAFGGEGVTPDQASVWGFWATVGGVVIGLITLGVVVAQALLMGRQQKTMERQLEIMKRQDELLNRRAALSVEANMTNVGPDTFRIDILAYNSGNRKAEDFYWHIGFPTNEVRDWLQRPGAGLYPRQPDTQLDGVTYTLYSDGCRTPLYPGRRMTLGFVLVERQHVAGPFSIIWQMTGEDGMFPSEGDMGKIEVVLGT